MVNSAGDRWTLIIMRELCFGARAFGELLAAVALISRTSWPSVSSNSSRPAWCTLRRHLYRLTPAGEEFRPIIELMSAWGQRWGQGLMGPDDLNPKTLVWGVRRQIDPAEIPAQGFVMRFDFRCIPKFNCSPRYWWLGLRPEDIEVCLKAPDKNVDIVICADLMTFTKVWLGYAGLAAALESGAISFQGSVRAIAKARRLLALPNEPELKVFKFSAFSYSSAVATDS